MVHPDELQDVETRKANKDKSFTLEFELTSPGNKPDLREIETLAQEVGRILRHKGFFVNAYRDGVFTPIR